MKDALNTRCSTDEMDEKQMTKTQLYQLRDNCKRHDHEIVEISEEYASGKDIDGR
jgi:DNA invertase Pin-like site-specific DNA recombinase